MRSKWPPAVWRVIGSILRIALLAVCVWRVGFAWSPIDSRRTIVRGSTGLFFDRVPLRALANALLSAGNTSDLANLRQTIVSLSPTQAGAPVFTNILSGAMATP